MEGGAKPFKNMKQLMYNTNNYKHGLAIKLLSGKYLLFTYSVVTLLLCLTFYIERTQRTL